MQIQIWDPESFLTGIRDGKIRIRNKHPGFAALVITHISSLPLSTCTSDLLIIDYLR